MNKICEHCDTRVRLNKCSGKEGAFRFCLRKVGSLNGLEKTISQFNEIGDIFVNNQSSYIQALEPESLVLDYEIYGHNNPPNMMLLWGRFSDDIDAKTKDRGYPVAYVTCAAEEFEYE